MAKKKVASASKRTKAATAQDVALASHPQALESPLVQLRLGSEAPVRLPDSSVDTTAAKVLKEEFTISSDAAGSIAFGLNPGLNGKLVWAITAGVLGASPTATAHPQATSLVAEARVARTIATRITVSFIGAAQTESGILGHRTVYNTADISSQSLETILSQSPVQVRPSEGLVVYSGYSQLPRWEDPNAPSFMSYTFPYEIITGAGLPFSVPQFRVRVLTWVEYIPIENTLSEGDLEWEPHDSAALDTYGTLMKPEFRVGSMEKMMEYYKQVSKAAVQAYAIASRVAPLAVPIARAALKTAKYLI